MKNLLITFIASLFCSSLFAQANAHFTTTGTVEYEKRVNMYAIIKKRLGNDEGGFASQAFENYKKTQPQFKSLKSTLTFTGNKTLFTPIPPAEAGNNWFGDMPESKQQNVIYTDLNTNVATASKEVFEEKFLLKDTLRKINWKITDETREIAGYNCRRANALIMDSVYVVAFYSDEIPVSGGPESFTGLPGMILGLALPHDNITWFATKVTDMPIAENQMKVPVKGKATTYKGFEATMKKVMKDWGTWGQSYLKVFLL
ncbi:GLPGLI family protein [Mucilaginibacter sp. 21P]|uniref:GLPGLI family protein n=1 Tax=Mucilaginibacter sp. 21P TaxID=2778902 RepID=UPI001C57C43F|nr:GLPGLI family protein [Mucilaginibacter sp. 21P]QXV65478.1 GLPGLI family protein [Mucilaginibacter sp. 21P]